VKFTATTADWHVGKTLKGRDRLDEQRAVLGEIASIAEANQVDAVLVAGDVYDLSAPSAPAQHAVVQATAADAPHRGRGHRHRGQPRSRADLRRLPAADERRRDHSGGHGPQVGRQRRSCALQSPVRRRRHAGRGAAVPVAAVGGGAPPRSFANSPSENVRAYDEQVRQVIRGADRWLRRRHRKPW